ncbi:hypothetical protein [Jeotgalibacillus salarius]|uniref:hypothetical protein n=1 Tax=Jeotgalibacillus salarius TaxID=546023 RepID=UPI00141AF1D0|nr:hypothetical protein [Jeotgalibacillus salarius]
MQHQTEKIEQQLAHIQKWLEDKDKTLEYAAIYEEISKMERELLQLKEKRK